MLRILRITLTCFRQVRAEALHAHVLLAVHWYIILQL